MLPHNDEQPALEKDVELVSEDDEDPNQEYKSKINMMLEMEKLRLVTLCCRAGMEEQEVDRILTEENVPDYDFENFKRRMGIKAEKKTYGQKVEERQQIEREKALEKEKQIKSRMKN